MKIIGLCGGSGSGKGCVGDAFSRLGFAVLDTDKIYHKLLASCKALLSEIRDTFGDGILTDGAVDRKKLGRIVFSRDGGEKLAKLNEITHRHILGEVRRAIAIAETLEARGVVVDAPLLFESGFDSECDATVAVIAEREKRISRIILRDGIGREDAIRRIDKQISDERLIELCDFTIFNNGEIDELNEQVSKIIDAII